MTADRSGERRHVRLGGGADSHFVLCGGELNGGKRVTTDDAAAASARTVFQTGFPRVQGRLLQGGGRKTPRKTHARELFLYTGKFCGGNRESGDDMRIFTRGN